MQSDALTGVADVALGDTVAGKYLIDSVLGVGGMGVVFRARHLEIEASVALKFLSAEFRDNAQAIGRFRREAKAVARLKSEHVVRVFDVGVHTNGLPYLVMEYLEGTDLGRLIRTGGPLPVEQAADLLLQTCRALEEAHAKGIVHRDLKPSNLFCLLHESGGYAIKVVDFGISKVTGDAASLEQGITVTGNIVGSPNYMSPEQMKNSSDVDRRTDIWSLGVVLYESVTGKLPFPGDTYAEICLRAHQDPPLPAAAHGVELPPLLESVIQRCLAKDPEQRFASAAALAEALLAFTPVPARTAIGSLTSTTSPGVRKGSLMSRFGLARATPVLVTSTLQSWARSEPPASRRHLPALLVAGACLFVGAAFVLLRQGSSTLAPARPASELPRGAPAKSAVITPPPPREESPRIAPLGPVRAEPVRPAAVPPPSAIPSANAPKPTSSSTIAPVRPRKGPVERDSRNSVWGR